MKRYLVAAFAATFSLSACGEMGDTVKDLFGKSSVKKSVAKVEVAAAPLTGAIFTTDSSGNIVNANIYTSKEDVYLNGGPKKPGAAGLPDGTYYYIVIDPGCKNELAGPGATAPYSTLAKTITVVDGEFTELMQLAPFMDTTNPGGEYQVRITRVEDYSPGEGCFGFLPNLSKMDNFKVRPVTPPEEPEFCISGLKCYDANGNGMCDSPEGPLAGITIVLHDDMMEELASTETSTIGAWSFCGLEPGDYHVVEVLPEDNWWEQTYPANDEGHDVTIVDEDVTGLLFTNFCRLESSVGPISPEPCELDENGIIVLE